MKIYKNKTTGERTCYNNARQVIAKITKQADGWILKVSDGTVKKFANIDTAVAYVETHYNF